VKLSKQAIRILEELKAGSPRTVDELESEGYDQSMVNRAALELKQKELVKIEEDEELVRKITDKGSQVLEEGAPEYQLVEELRDGPKNIGELTEINTDVAIGKAKQKQWIDIDQGEISLTDKGRDVTDDSIQRKLEKRKFDDELEGRGLVKTETETVKVLKLSKAGKKQDIEDIEEEFNVEADVEMPSVGKKHFYRQIMDYARQKWLEIGFQEMSGDYVVSSLMNFDALNTPQDHPARELHDTFFLDQPVEADLMEYGDKVQHIKETHEDGWETGSTGWDYDWKEVEAAKNVLRTHTTAVSAQRLHEIDINQEELPKKFFVLGRNFRNETVDRHHLAEFYQTDGIVVGEDLSFRNLKAYISEFFEKMGYEEFRLIPSYYPYTEMSVEVQVYDEDAEKWIGLGGAGMFRPEVVKPLLGFEATVLAWGLGIGRIAMKAAEIDDIRELYRNDLEILEETPSWRPDIHDKGGVQ
jgi:phenylalanyl-tRNA synthetase alpha chain